MMPEQSKQVGCGPHKVGIVVYHAFRDTACRSHSSNEIEHSINAGSISSQYRGDVTCSNYGAETCSTSTDDSSIVQLRHSLLKL
jgi:hypothetical protein